jgi:hypothetical protein
MRYGTVSIAETKRHAGLSLFDDNPLVKRTFCPPKECYDPRLNADGRYAGPLLRLEDVVCTVILSPFASLRVDCAEDHCGWFCFRQLR